MPRGQIAFFVDATKCINCKTCEIACTESNGSGSSRRMRKVRTFERGDFPHVVAYNISMSCNHCELPACLEHCPTGAYTKRASDGIVVHDPEKCIGCRYCTWLCPYGAPEFDEDERKVGKCNLCVDEIETGEMPACVKSCPMRVIEVGLLEEIDGRHGATISVKGLPPPEVTRPACRYRVRIEARDV